MATSTTSKRYIGRVSPKGQVTLPIEVREAMGLKPKDRVAFLFKNGVLTVKPAHDSLLESFQSVPALSRRLTDNEMTEIAAEEAALEAYKVR